MGLFEIILVCCGISFDVLAVSVCYGAVLMKIEKLQLLKLTLIFCLMQVGSAVIGNLFTLFPMFRNRENYSENLYSFCSIVILVALGLFLLYKGWKHGDILERRTDINFKNVWLTAIFSSIDSFFAGLGLAFMGIDGLEILFSVICLIIITAIAVGCGLYIGYHLGYEPKKNVYRIGCGVLFVAAADVLIRLIVN